MLLYRLATGTPAFSAPTTLAMLMEVATHEPPAASAVKPTVPGEMARIIAKLMAKKREERYASAAEFLADWEQLTRSPKAEAATEAFAKGTGPRRPGSGPGALAQSGPQATMTAAPEPASGPSAAGRGSAGRRLKLIAGVGVFAILLLALGAWFLIPRGTDTPAVVKKKDDPPPVIPAAKEPPPLDETNAKEVQSAWSAKLKVPVEQTSPSGIVMVLIPPGELVKYPYRLGKYEVTQDEWQKVMGYNPSNFKGPNLPVETVNWFDSVEFCNKLSEREKLPPYYDVQVKTRKGAWIEDAEVKILGGTG